MELYINNIFVNPEVHDIYIKRIGFSLIRVYRQHNQRCNSDNTDEKLLSQLKWPIEYMFVGLRPTWNIKDVTVSGAKVTGNQNQWRDWHRLTRTVDATHDKATYSTYNREVDDSDIDLVPARWFPTSITCPSPQSTPCR